jgi:succinate--hydroxymethylglutarate CoA-transferase
MQDALLASVGTRMGETLQAGISPGRLGNENPLRVPANTYRTADGLYIAMMVHNQAQWKPFCEAMGKGEWIEHPRLCTMPLRVQNREEVNQVVARRFAEQNSGYWMARLEEYGIPYALVNDYARALDDPQAAHRGLIHELNHPRSGKIKVVGPPWKMSKTEARLTSPPLLGEHNDEVLREWLGTKAGAAVT